MQLSADYPFLNKYFEIAAADKRPAHCILFYGSDFEAQYSLALEIARVLNCTGDRTDSCGCLNCSWIRENKHPAVLTISKSDNKFDNSKNVISIEQARMIKNDLLVTSDFHRVLIFCDRDEDGNVCGLNEWNFQSGAANALLKTFEEPPENTTFFFLAKDKTDLISTIVSRAQSFFVPSFKPEDRDFSIVEEVIGRYFELERSEVLDLNEKITALLKENDALAVLNQIQNYMYALLKQNLHMKSTFVKNIAAVETAKKQLKLNMNTQTIIDSLCFDLVLAEK